MSSICPKRAKEERMRKLSNHTHHRVGLFLALISLMGGIALPGYSWSRCLSDRATIPVATNPSWTSTGSLNTARYFHTATLLPNGKVLVAGGFGNNIYLKSAEIYDPGAGTFTATGNMITARSQHTATLLPNGRVLIARGDGDGVGRLASA